VKIVGQGRGVQAGKTERKERKAAHLAHGLTSSSFTLTFFHSAHPCSWKRTMCQGKGPQVHVQRAELRQDQAESHSDPFFRNLACSIPILCLLISQWILSSSRPHKHQAVRSVPRKRILDQYFLRLRSSRCLFVFFTFLQPIDFYTAEKYARRAGRRCFFIAGVPFRHAGHSRARAYLINTSAEKYK
jgi:hypothetical protein